MVSSLNVAEFARDLSGHPDREAVSYVLNGLQHGFRLGFQPTRRIKSNKPLRRSPSIVPLIPLLFPDPNLHVSSFGVIPKKGQPGKWRLIVDLSSPNLSSVNDGINAEEFSMQYITVDQIIGMVSKYGPGALMAKFDEAAYRNIAVNPADCFLLGMKWRGKYFVDLALPFGPR